MNKRAENKIVDESSPEGFPHKIASRGGEIGGLFLLATSIVFMVEGLGLGLGSPFRLGTGAFPFFTGLCLAGLSTAITIQSWQSSEGLSNAPDWVNFASILTSIAVFAATVDRVGLIPAVFLTILVASSADRDLTLFGKVALGSVVALGSWLIFIVALNLPFKAIVGV